MGTPSAPPIMETGREVNSVVHEPEIEQTGVVEVFEYRETEAFIGNRDSLADKKWQSMPSAEFVDR